MNMPDRPAPEHTASNAKVLELLYIAVLSVNRYFVRTWAIRDNLRLENLFNPAVVSQLSRTASKSVFGNRVTTAVHS